MPSTFVWYVVLLTPFPAGPSGVIDPEFRPLNRQCSSLRRPALCFPLPPPHLLPRGSPHPPPADGVCVPLLRADDQHLRVRGQLLPGRRHPRGVPPHRLPHPPLWALCGCAGGRPPHPPLHPDEGPGGCVRLPQLPPLHPRLLHHRGGGRGPATGRPANPLSNGTPPPGGSVPDGPGSRGDGCLHSHMGMGGGRP